MKKIFKTIAHSFIIVLSNKPRYLLTCAGIIFSIVIFTCGSVIFSTFSYQQIVTFDGFDDNSVVAKIDGNDYDKLGGLSRALGGVCTVYFDEGISSVALKKGTPEYVRVYLRTFGVDYDFLSSPVPAVSGRNLTNCRLLEGRTFNKADVIAKAEVAILTKSCAEVLFDGDCIGRTVSTQAGTCTVIGVVSDDQDAIEAKNNLLNLKKSKNAYVEAEIRAYVPYTVGYRNNNPSFAVFSQQENAEYSAQLIDKTFGGKSYTHERAVQAEYEVVRSTRTVMQAALLVLFLVSAVSIAVAMSFSVKERISEIGIKKAIGATDSDITLQFACESIIMAVFTSVIGVLIGFALGAATVMIMGLGFVSCEPSTLLLPLCSDVFICLLASLIPSIVASKYNIVQALRFE